MYTESSFFLFMHSKWIQKLTEIIRVERREGLSKYLLFTSEQTVIFCSSRHFCHLCNVNVNFSFEQKLIGLVSLSFDIFCFHATSCMCKKLGGDLREFFSTWWEFKKHFCKWESLTRHFPSLFFFISKPFSWLRYSKQIYVFRRNLSKPISKPLLKFDSIKLYMLVIITANVKAN